MANYLKLFGDINEYTPIVPGYVKLYEIADVLSKAKDQNRAVSENELGFVENRYKTLEAEFKTGIFAKVDYVSSNLSENALMGRSGYYNRFSANLVRTDSTEEMKRLTDYPLNVKSFIEAMLPKVFLFLRNY